MALSGSTVEGNYASPQSSRSGSISELGLTLLPSCQAGGRRGTYDDGVLPAGQNGGPHPFEGTSSGLNYPSPTSTIASFPLVQPPDPPNYPVNVSNGGHFKQSLSTVTNDQSTLLYRPSAPHLHTLVSTGTTVAAATQLDRLKERNRQLTIDRDRFYHLSKPEAVRADDGKMQQIRDLRAELNALTEQNYKLGYALEYQLAQTRDALIFAAKQKAQYEALQAAYNAFITPVPFMPLATALQRPSAYIDLTSPNEVSAPQQQGGLRERTSSSATAVFPTTAEPRPLAAVSGTQYRTSSSATSLSTTPTERGSPAPTRDVRKRSLSAAASQQDGLRERTTSSAEDRQPTASNDRPAKRQRKDSTTDKQPRKDSTTDKPSRKGYSMVNGSQMSSIQARLRQELKGRKPAYAWANEDAATGQGEKKEEEMEKDRVVEAAIVRKDVGREEADDEPSEWEIEAFNRALMEDSEGEGQGEKSGAVEADGDAHADGDGVSLFGGD